MAKLILKRFHCVVDTDESGAESPYFLSFVADIGTGATHLKMTRQGNWHNEVDQGEIWTVNDTVADGFALVPSKTLVLSAMVEEDEGLDVTTNELALIKQMLTTKWNSIRQSGANIVNGSVSGPMATTMRTMIALALSSSAGANDDPMGVKVVKLTGQAGELELVRFQADDGLYRVRYAQA
ncbi:MAG: hypothetical protein HY855_25880 [Burkholderiales bacterium]|nr:hypothetical protein [Burkholderiales bacterium]